MFIRFYFVKNKQNCFGYIFYSNIKIESRKIKPVHMIFYTCVQKLGERNTKLHVQHENLFKSTREKSKSSLSVSAHGAKGSLDSIVRFLPHMQ